MLLPGIIAAQQFYSAAETAEAEVLVPPLSTAGGIALVGVFSIGVHFVYIVVLAIVRQYPPLIPLPLADPYRFLAGVSSTFDFREAFAMVGGLALMCLTAIPVGRLTALVVLEKGDKAIFYGPMTEIVMQGHGDDAFVAAYVISKLTEGDRLIGYQGTVAAMIPDENRMPTKLVLKDVTMFYLNLEKSGPSRVETKQALSWLTLSASEWHNVAFKIYREV